jgi:ubiquinone/menaquinone biosynthesis C-methylase UbiE
MAQAEISTYWKAHFAARHRARAVEGVAKSLDYSNERVQAQTYSAVLEAMGPVEGRAVWDVGCGWGRLSLLLQASGACVTASDIVPETIERLRVEHPAINWRELDVMDEQAVEKLPQFDFVVACEILQHVRHDVVRGLWRHVAAGGRLIGCVSNRDCPIVTSVLERYPGTYMPMSEGELFALAADLDSVEDLWMKGLAFREDQRFLPYAASDWGKKLSGTPNRLVFVMTRAKQQGTGVMPDAR